MSIEAWPFLISRNKILDYSVIVAPNFMVREDYSKLISLTNGDVTDANMWQTMHDTSGQKLTLVFRIEQAELEGKRARDGFGRLIVWVVGFVLRGSAEKIPVAEEVFEAIGESISQSYWEFWNQSEHTFAVPSDTVHLGLKSGGSAKLTLSSPEEDHTAVNLSESGRSLEFKITNFLVKLRDEFMMFFRSR